MIRVHTTLHKGLARTKNWRILRLELTWSVPPRLVVGSKHPQMAASHKVLIVQSKEWVGGIQKLGMEHNLKAYQQAISIGYTTQVLNSNGTCSDK